MFSVLILTKDEAANLPGCLASVNWCDDVVVLDSFSADQTIALAQAGGTRIFQRVFDDFAWQRMGGLLWEQLAFLTLALAGLVTALVTGGRFLRWAALYTLIVAIVLSLTPYKTPWHATHLVPGLALLAAGALAAIPVRPLAFAAAAACLAMLAAQTWRAAFLRPADARNPYAYVHSSPDVLKYRALVEAALQRAPGEPVRIIGEEYWPLPWYLRGLPRIGYWITPPKACDGALIITTAAQSAAVRARLRGAYRESSLGLRPGLICTVFTPMP